MRPTPPATDWKENKNAASPPTHTPLSVSSVSSVSSDSSVDLLPAAILYDVAQAVEATALTSPKTSRYRQFAFARRIKAIERCHEVKLTPRQHAAIYERWHKRNRAFLTLGRDYFAEYLARFSSVRFPEGEKLKVAYQRALTATPTSRVLCYPIEVAHVLANLCRELQLVAGDKPFFLSCRSAAKLMDVHYTTVSQWLRAFQTLGILKLVERGKLGSSKEKGVQDPTADKHENRASRYRYIADD